MRKHGKSIRIMAYLMTFAVTATTLFSDVNMLTAYAEDTETVAVESVDAETEEPASVDFGEEVKESPEGEQEESVVSSEKEDADENKDSQESESVAKGESESVTGESGETESEDKESTESEESLETEETDAETETGTESETETEAETETEEEGVTTLTQEIGNLTVEAAFEKGVLPEGTELVVKEVSGKSYDEQLKEKATEQGRVLTARKYYDVSFLLDGEAQEPENGSVDVRFYYSQSVAVNAVSKSEIEAQAEALDSTEEKDEAVQGVTITGNVLKIDGEEVLAVLGKNVSEDDLKAFSLKEETESDETEAETEETKVTVTEDAKVEMYHFTGSEVKAVSADIQTTEGNKLKEVSFSSDSFSVYAVAISNSAESENGEVVETSKTDISAQQLIDFINEQFKKGNSIALGQNLLIPGGNKRIEIPADKRVVLYLNGYTIQPVEGSTRTDAVIAVSGKSIFTIKDKLENSSKVSTGEGTGSIQNFKGAPVIKTVGSNAELYIKDIEISNNNNENGEGGVIEDAYSQNDTKIELSNATFQNNKANRGGVVRAASSRITVENCTFTNNSVNEEGGVFFLDGGSDVHGAVLTIKSGKFYKNTAAKQGGAISGSQDTSVTVESGIFEQNKAGRGGAIYLNNSEYKDATTSLVISGGEFVENEAESKVADGGDMWNNWGGGAIFVAADNIELSGDNTKIDKNWTGAGGGGIRINRGTFIMKGGSVTNNIATGNEGGGISLHNATAVIVKGTISGNMTGYNKDGKPNTSYADWGGGGIFCSQDATLLIRNAKITDNNAYGFGGGVAGCATGRVFLFETDGCAIYQNKNYADLGQSEPKLSGALSHKNYDRLYAATNETFMKEGSSDFYCALNSSVSWKMRGVDAGWKGSVDGVAVNDNMKANDADYLNASYLMGLTANPKGSFDNNFGVIITGNTSRTHGGGILNNGYLVAGKTVKISTGSRLEVNALKALLSDGKYDALTDADKFDFSIVEVDAKDILINGGFTSNGVNDTKGDITFDALIPFTEAGTFYYIVKENPGDRSDIKYTDTQYKIVVKTAEKLNGTIPVLEESGITISEINKYQVKIQSVEVYKKQAGGEWTDVTNNCTYSEASDDHASAIALGKYEGEGDKRHVVGGDKAAFINEKYNQDYVNIEIKKNWNDPDWLEKADHPTLTFNIYRYGENEKDKKLVDTVTLKNGETKLTVGGAGNENYVKYYDLENYKPYTYVVEEQKVENYEQIESSSEEKDGSLVFIFTNKRVAEPEQVEILVKKNWNDPEWLENVPHKATFRLYRYTTDENNRTEVGSITLEGEKVSGTFGEQDKYYDVWNHKEYTYVVEEDDVAGYKNTAVGVNEDKTEWTFTNEKTVADKVTLVLSKVSSKDEKKMLEGAEFDLYLVKEDGKELIGHGVTNENGQLSFKGLEAGKYQLIETKAPAGYQLSKDIYEVTLTKEQIGAAGVVAEKLNKAEGEIGITITNTPDDPKNPETPKTPNTPSDPGTPNTPGTPDNPGNPTTIGTPVIPLGSDVLGAERVPDVTITADVLGENRPQTGDDTNVWGLAAAALACVGVLGVYAWKRKKREVLETK